MPLLEKASQETYVALKEIFSPIIRQKKILQMGVEDNIEEVDLTQSEIETNLVDMGEAVQKS